LGRTWLGNGQKKRKVRNHCNGGQLNAKENVKKKLFCGAQALFPTRGGDGGSVKVAGEGLERLMNKRQSGRSGRQKGIVWGGWGVSQAYNLEKRPARFCHPQRDSGVQPLRNPSPVARTPWTTHATQWEITVGGKGRGTSEGGWVGRNTTRRQKTGKGGRGCREFSCERRGV